MAFEFQYRRRVEFADTDLAGIVHFANYLRYMEVAEHAFFRSLGLSVHASVDGRYIGWPRARAECNYRAPARFEDELDIHLIVREKNRKTITYDFDIRALDSRAVADGSVTVVCVSFDPATERMRAIPIPEWVDARIEAAPKDRTPAE